MKFYNLDYRLIAKERLAGWHINIVKLIDVKILYLATYAPTRMKGMLDWY